MKRLVTFYDTRAVLKMALKRLNKRIKKEDPSIWNDEDGRKLRLRMLKAGTVLWHGNSIGRRTRKEYSAAMTEFWRSVRGNMQVGG